MLSLTEKLKAIDTNNKALWDSVDDEQRKILKNDLFVLNRFVSNAQSKRRRPISQAEQEHFVLSVNSLYNTHWFTLSNHPKLLWYLLCMCNYNNTVYDHSWIGFKKTPPKNKKVLLMELYPNMKLDDLNVMAELMTDAEYNQLLSDHGISKKTKKTIPV
jgi:hypothetical protein